MAEDAGPEAAEPAVAEPKKKTKETEELLKPVPKPNEDELKEKIEEQNEKVAAHQAPLAAIKEILDARDSGRGDSPEVAVAKAQLNEAKTKSRMLQQEKRNIYDQISAA